MEKIIKVGLLTQCVSSAEMASNCKIDIFAMTQFEVYQINLDDRTVALINDTSCQWFLSRKTDQNNERKKTVLTIVK